MDDGEEMIHRRRRASRAASTALFLGMVAFIASVVVVGGIVGVFAVAMGQRATRAIDESEGRIGGRPMARAGVFLGWLAIALAGIALIAWVVMPRLGRTKAVERVVVTETHMRGILIACRLYALDHEDHLPPHLAAAMTGYGLTPDMLQDARHARLPMQLPPGATDGRVDWHTFSASVDADCDFIFTGAGLKVSALDPRVIVLVAKEKTGKKWLVGKVGGEVEEIDDADFHDLLNLTNDARKDRGLEPIQIK